MTAMNSPAIFECPAGLRSLDGGSALWVRSPKTGNTVSVPADRFPLLPPQLVSRVAEAAAAGRHVVAFTRDELVSLVQAVGRAEAADAKPPAPSPEPEPSPYIRRSFWGSPTMSRAQAASAAASVPVEPPAGVEQVTITFHRLPAIIGTEGIHNDPFLCITLSDRHVTFRPHDWPRLPAGIIERVKAAKAGDLVEFSGEEIAAVEAVWGAADKAITGNTGVARSCRARKR